jgi:hypothetical protein
MSLRRAAVALLLLLLAALPLLAGAPPAPAADQAFLASLAAPANGALPAPVPPPAWMTCLSECEAQRIACRQACHGDTQCQAGCNQIYNCSCTCRGNGC